MTDALTGKFGFQVDSGDHTVMKLVVDGVYVARTKVSYSHRDLSSQIVGAIARQVGVNAGQLRQMVGCTISRDAYLEILEQAESNPAQRYGRH